MFRYAIARCACILFCLVLLGMTTPALAWTYCRPVKNDNETCLSAAPENRKCLQLGAITTDRGHRSLIACLATNAGANCGRGDCEWQAVNNPAPAVPSGTMCGYALLIKVCARASGADCLAWESEAEAGLPCNGVSLIGSNTASDSQLAASLTGGCPAGYRLFSLTKGTPVTAKTIIPEDSTGKRGNMAITCVKD